MLCGIMLSYHASAITTNDLTGFDNLTAVQRAEIAKTIAETAALNSKPNQVIAPSAEDIGKYADIGQSVAKALGAAMKELNVEANNFLTTPVGMITTGLIVYKVLGNDVLTQIHDIIQSFVFTTIWLGYLFWYIRNNRDVRIKYSTTKFNWLNNPVIEEYYKEGLSDDRSWAIVLISLFCLAITIILL